MKIFSFLPKDEKCFLNTIEKKDSKFIIDNLSKGKYEKLKPASIELVMLDNLDSGSQLSDIPWLYPEGVLCRKKAFELLEPFLKGCGAWNVFKLDKERVYYFSVTSELDALDSELTEFIEHGGFKLGAKKYVFKKIDYNAYPIFRMKSLKGHYPVVTEEFVDFIKTNKLTGLKFKELK